MQDMDVVDDFDGAPKRVKSGGGFLGKFIAVILGLIIGIIAGAGGLFGIGYALIAHTKIKTNIGTINGFIDPDIDYSKFLSEKYGEETLVTLIGDTVTAIQNVSKGEGSLNTLNEISPLIGNMLIGENGDAGLVKMLNEYYLNLDPAKVMSLTVVKPNGAESNPDVYLMDYLKNSLNDVPVADFLIKLNYPLNDTLLTICCGIEGTQWERNDDGTIRMLNGNTQLTLGEFLSEDLEKRIYSLPLDAIMPVSLSDQVMMMLAYGDEFCYHQETRNGKTVIVMNQVYYTYDMAKGKLYNGRGAEIDPATISNLNIDVANAVGTCQVQVDADTVHYLNAQEWTGDRVTLYAYSSTDYVDSQKVFYPKTTINDLQSGAVNLVEDMYLKDVLNIGANSDRMLRSLAYGVENVDYTIVEENGTKKIVSINPPRTIGDLRDCGEDLIYEIYLRDVIDAEPDDLVTMYILYGKKGLHYSVGAGDVITMLQKQVAIVGDQVYNEYGDELIGTLTGNSFTVNGVTYTRSTATGETLTTIDNTTATLYYVVDEYGDPVPFPYITLGDLKGNSPILENITKRLTLADVLTESAFDSHGVLSKLKDVCIADVPKRMETMTVGEVYGNGNVFLKALQDAPLEQLSDAVDALTIGELFGDRDGNDNLIYVPDPNGIYVSDGNGGYVVDPNGNGTHSIPISNNPILNALSSTKISNLQQRALEITIGELIPNAKDNKVLKHLLDATFTTLDSKVNALKFGDVFNDDLWVVYDSANPDHAGYTSDSNGFALDSNNKRIMKAIWKYMLYEDVETADTTNIPTYYIVTQENSSDKDINKMMSNMTSNMQNTKLSQLLKDGLITYNGSKDFSTLYVPDSSKTNGKFYLADMTIVDMINYLASNSLQD